MIDKLREKVSKEVLEVISAIHAGEDEYEIEEMIDKLPSSGGNFLEPSSGDMIAKKDVKRLDFTVQHIKKKDRGVLTLNRGTTEKTNFANEQIILVGTTEECEEEFKLLKIKLDS